MKADIHPEYVETAVTCTCGSTFTTRSTAKNGVIHADVCSHVPPVLHGQAEDSRHGLVALPSSRTRYGTGPRAKMTEIESV